MVISVIVCTYNGEERVLRCLDSIAGAKVSDEVGEVEVLTVDNSSRDDTRERVLDFISLKAGGDIVFQYVYEAELGLSRARNRGIEESRGEIIAFVDDDAVVAPDWLLEMAGAYRTLGADIIGGRTLSRPLGVPAGVDPRVIEGTGAFDLGPESVILKRRRSGVHGCNFSCKRKVFDILGGFHSSFGRVGENKFAEEEYHLCLRAKARGLTIGYSPSIVVYHEQEESRFLESAVLDQAYRHGLSRCLAECDVLGKTWIAASALKKITINFVRNYIGYLLSSTAARTYWMVRIKSDAGFLAGAFRIFFLKGFSPK
jgi:glycosyltransferase involved in cell wall biosynthesis